VKKSILLVADRPEWAYHNIAEYLIRAFGDKYRFYIDFLTLSPGFAAPGGVLSKAALKREWQKLRYRRVRRDRTYDIVFFLGFYMYYQYPVKINASAVIFGIYTECFPPCGFPGMADGISRAEFCRRFLNPADILACGNPAIMDAYTGFFPRVLWANTPLEDIFFRKQVRHGNFSPRFIVGWSGQKDRPIKGYHDYVVPAVALAAGRRPGIELKTREFGPRSTLPAFYDDVDVVLIASESEAGPALFAEAAAADIPAISTRVGYPGLMIEDGVNGFLVARDVNEIAERLVYLYDHRDVLASMSARIRSDIEDFLGAGRCYENWRTIFEAGERISAERQSGR